MELFIKKIALKAKIKSPDLITRSTGKALFREMDNLLAIRSPYEVIVMDFYDTGVMDSSCIDECVIQLMKKAIESEPPFYVRARNVSVVNQVNIDSVIRTFSKFNCTRLVLIIDEMTGDNTFYLGELHSEEKEVISCIILRGSTTIAQLSVSLDMDEIKIREIVQELHALRILRIDGQRIASV